MAYRTKTKKSTDNRAFRNTAKKTKRINIAPRISRGGIML